MTISVEIENKTVNHQRSHYMYQAPKILIVHIKRFKMGHYSSKKLTTDVELDNKLVLNWKQLDDSSSAKYQAKTSNLAEYNLCSIVHHKGSMESGHYFWEIKDGSKWYTFNDEYVKATPVLATSKTWYIMFYIKIN